MASTLLHYAIAATSDGCVLLAGSDKGIRALFLGDDDETLEAALEEAFPGVELRRDKEAVSKWMQPVLDYLESGGDMPDLPLDPEGTPFQCRVWDLLRAIPSGETRTYGELAETLGLPGGARAVGAACAANRIAVLIPCHRAVREDGGLGGYRWGISRKRHLLELERHAQQMSLF
jgi:AraC family transcriptional regulator of adaptative response/methylated-DNA-[protein]-cysteine methyltransferase